MLPAPGQVYVWGRRHPYVHLNFLGLFNFTAPYLPWVLLAFSVTLRSNAVVDLLGIVAGVIAVVSVSFFCALLCTLILAAVSPRLAPQDTLETRMLCIKSTQHTSVERRSCEPGISAGMHDGL